MSNIINDININTPVEPEIELDGGYARCPRCCAEVQCMDKCCKRCAQLIDWSWMHQYTIVRG